MFLPLLLLVVFVSSPGPLSSPVKKLKLNKNTSTRHACCRSLSSSIGHVMIRVETSWVIAFRALFTAMTGPGNDESIL